MLPPAIAPARAAAASRRRPSSRASRRSASQSCGLARSRQAAVGISDGGSRQQRLSDVAVAARARQPDVAGAERVPQVEQHRRLPEAVIGLGAQQPGSTSNSAAGSPVGRAVPSVRRTPTASSKGSAAGDASMSSVRSIRGV